MRTIYRLDGKMINLDAPRVVGDVSYPHLRDVWSSVGVVQAQVDDFPDCSVFNVSEDEAGNLTITPKTPEQLEINRRSEMNAISVSPWQIRKALSATGLREAVEAAVLAADLTTQDAWHYATEFSRANPLVSAVGAALGKTEKDLDDLFLLAKTL